MVKKYLIRIEDSCPYLTIPFWFVAESERIPEIGMKNSYKCKGHLTNIYPKCNECSETRTIKITGLQVFSKKGAGILGASKKVFKLESILHL